MACIVNRSNFVAKRSTQLYLGGLGCGIVPVHSLHSSLTHGSKKFHAYCDGHTPVNGNDLLAKLCEGSQYNFPT